jgi:hypothetical protein
MIKRLPALMGALYVALTLVASGASGAPSSARAAGTCGIPSHGQHLGPTYLTWLSVSGTSCSMGLKVVRDYHSCQIHRGGVTARCYSVVDGYRCTEKRGPSIPTEFFSSVSCQDRSARVYYKYSQFS